MISVKICIVSQLSVAFVLRFKVSIVLARAILSLLNPSAPLFPHNIK